MMTRDRISLFEVTQKRHGSTSPYDWSSTQTEDSNICVSSDQIRFAKDTVAYTITTIIQYLFFIIFTTMHLRFIRLITSLLWIQRNLWKWNIFSHIDHFIVISCRKSSHTPRHPFKTQHKPFNKKIPFYIHQNLFIIFHYIH